MNETRMVLPPGGNMKPLPVQDRMNKTEARYSDYLEKMKIMGTILDYEFEAVKLRLAQNTFYTPDFFVIFHGHFEVHEVKGFWRDDARVKIKVAAKLFPWWKFIAVQWVKKQWKIEEIKY